MEAKKKPGAGDARLVVNGFSLPVRKKAEITKERSNNTARVAITLNPSGCFVGLQLFPNAQAVRAFLREGTR